MNWRIDFSKEALKFINYNKINEEEIIAFLIKSIQKLKGENISIDLKKMKGNWKGFYRIRIGKIRIIFMINFDIKRMYLDRIDFRGNVYK